LLPVGIDPHHAAVMIWQLPGQMLLRHDTPAPSCPPPCRPEPLSRIGRCQAAR
jgi:hypothetical protein